MYSAYKPFVRCFKNIFSHLVTCLFIFSAVSLEEEKFFGFGLFFFSIWFIIVAIFGKYSLLHFFFGNMVYSVCSSYLLCFSVKFTCLSIYNHSLSSLTFIRFIPAYLESLRIFFPYYIFFIFYMILTLKKVLSLQSRLVEHFQCYISLFYLPYIL